MIQSVDRAVRVLSALRGSRRMALSELAAALGLPASTVHGIVKTLAREITKKLLGDAKKATEAETLTRALSIEVAELADALARRY